MLIRAYYRLRYRIQRWRRRPWSPFGTDGYLRPDLFVPVDQGGQGFTRVGALVEDDEHDRD